MRLRHQIALFLVYFILFLTITAMIDYYAYDIINPWIFIVLSLLGSGWAVKIHSKSHRKSKIDDWTKEVEEIL